VGTVSVAIGAFFDCLISQLDGDQQVIRNVMIGNLNWCTNAWFFVLASFKKIVSPSDSGVSEIVWVHHACAPSERSLLGHRLLQCKGY
jgi:hypothetical protein